MPVDIRTPTEDELEPALVALYATFGDARRPEDAERDRKTMPLERTLAAYDNGRPVGVAAAWPFELTIPGGQLPVAGVTWVGVLPSHRRRGILTQLMRRQLGDAREAGEPVAVLWASEAAIYGRFGYGLSVQHVRLEAERARFAFRHDPGPSGQIRFVDRDEAKRLFPPVYDRVRVQTPGMLTRSAGWWREYNLADPEHWRRGGGPKFYAVLDLGGGIEGFATWRIKSEWEQGIPRSQVRVFDAIATSPAATRELWRFLFDIDLVARVQQHLFDPGSPLFLTVHDPRRLHLRLRDGLWLRLVDVEAALRARSYAADDAVVLELSDEFCPWNAGRWRVSSEVERTDRDADLQLDVRDLACAYLGAFDFHRLAAAELVRELRPGALERASALFRTTRPPYCADPF